MSSGEMEGVVSILGGRLDFLKQFSGCFLDFVSFFFFLVFTGVSFFICFVNPLYL